MKTQRTIITPMLSARLLWLFIEISRMIIRDEGDVGEPCLP